MLSEKTQLIICNILNTIAYNEMELDAARINLINHSQFDPYSIFKRIDTTNSNCINEQNILYFLKDNLINCSSKEIQTIISLYDIDKHLMLSYEQFLNLILIEGMVHKHYISNKINYTKSFPYSLEFLVCRIFQKELNLVNKLNMFIHELKQTKDFSVFDMFQMIKANSGTISQESIGLFMKKNNFILDNDDLRRIIRKLDVDKNGVVSIEDLEIIFGKDKEQYIKDDSSLLKKQMIGNGVISPINANNNTLKDGNIFTNTNKENKTFYMNHEQPIPDNQEQNQRISYPNQENNFSNKKTNIYNKPNPFINNSSQTYSTNIKVIISFLRKIMDIELRIENLKIKLALNEDFNIDDAFRLFEHSNPHVITESDLHRGLNILGINLDNEDIYLLMYKYSISGQNTLNYADLFDMLTPFNHEYRKDIEHRKANPYSPKYNKEDIFIASTKECLVNLFEFIMKAEKSVEKERKELNKVYDLNIRTAFKMIDKSQSNKLSILDMNLFLKEYCVNYIPKEVELLFIRLDRSREGKIGLQDFVSETIPKLLN